jgi:hypothetical protein
MYGRLDGPQGWSGRMRKILIPPEFDPRAIRPVASRYTDFPIPCNNRVNTLNLSKYYIVIYPRLIKTEKFLSISMLYSEDVHFDGQLS